MATAASTWAIFCALQLVEGEPPQAGEAERGDVAPVSQPNAAIDGGDAVVLLRALRGEDVDGDGLSTREERETFASNPFLADTDGDGTPDGAEDPDEDGLTHLAELQAGTDPWLADTDGDGLLDGPDAEPLRGTRYRHADHLGSTLVETGAAPGAIASAAYRPYGQSAGAVEFGYTGQRHEAGVGLYDYKARWYDPALGRFLQPDPIVGDAFDPQALNPYSYVRGSPTNLTDPTGLSPLNDLGVALGFGPGALSPVTSYPQDAIPGYGIGSLSERPGLVDASSFTLFSSITHSGSDPTGGGLQVFGAGSARGIPERQRLDQTTSGGESSSQSLANEAVPLSPGIGPFDPTPDYDLGPGNGLIPNAFNCGGRFCESSVYTGVEVLAAVPLVGTALRWAALNVVTRTGIRITGFTRHGLERVIGDGAKRAGVTPKALNETLRSGEMVAEGIDRLGRPFQILQSPNARVIINPQTGKIVSANPLSGVGAN